MSTQSIRGAAARIALALAAVTAVLGAGAAGAQAATGPHWTVISTAAPTYFHAGDRGDFYEVDAMNDGGAPTSGTITVADTLPHGVTVTGVVGTADQGAGKVSLALSCSQETKSEVVTVTCTTAESVPSDATIGIKADVNVPFDASGSLASGASISGGGAAAASDAISTPVVPAGTPVPFGVAAVTDFASQAGGTDTQAGSHPYAFTTLLAYNSAGVARGETCGAALVTNDATSAGCATRVGEGRDIEVELPPGMIGNVTSVPRCTQQEFQSGAEGACPASTQVGVMQLAFYGDRTLSYVIPVYNIAPPAGTPAELGFTLSTIGRVAMLFHLRRIPGGGGYAITADTPRITQFLQLQSLALTVWGVPAEASHDLVRKTGRGECDVGSAPCPSYAKHAPFLTVPTSCTGVPLSAGFGVDSWQEPIAGLLPISLTTSMPGMEGCGALSFQEPSLVLESDTAQAGSPSGYHVHLQVPQNEEPEGLATPAVRDVTVQMPEGTTVSPSAANGLTACSDERFALEKEGPGACPQSSKIGSVSIVSPLVEVPLEGSVYVGEPECGAGGSCSPQQAAEGKLVKLLIEARLPEPPPRSSNPPVLIKLAGHTEIDQSTGRLTAVFEEDPQLPFSEMELSLKNGQDAPLVNPTACANIAASAKLTGWSGAVAQMTSPGQPITGCAPAGFTPSMQAGMTTTPDGGAYSGFAVTLSRPAGQQSLGSVTVHMPPGLVGMLSSVPLCGEAQANAGTCPASSQIGTTSVVVGPGSQPYSIEGGAVYLTGKYGSAPFGLSIVTPAKAGPFQLAGNAGNGSEVVRAGIEIDPHTAAVTISTGQLPTALDGIPIGIDRVIVNVNRPDFMFNPTDCATMAVTGTVVSSSGTAAGVSTPFQAENCASLPFHPVFKALTHARHSRKKGAYFHVVVRSGQGQANIHEVKVELPKALPSELKTLQHACTEEQFAKNPAGCPAESVVGHARAVTPVLPVPLTGPAYFVSHGGKKFPELIVVLQGYGVTVDLAGETFISKAGVTSSTFKTVPDVPVTRFDLVLPQREYSALGATTDFCRHPQKMPTRIVAQSGKVIEGETPIQVSGCGTFIAVRGKHVHGDRATILLHASSAGRLVANGKGIAKAVKRVKKKGGRVGITVHLTAHMRKMLRHGHSMKVRVHLTFKAKSGKGKAKAEVTVKLR